MKNLSWMETGGREIGLVRRIGEMLRFQTDSQVLGIAVAIGSFKGAPRKIGGEDLNAGLGRKHLHCTAGVRVNQFCAKHQIAGGFVIENQAMVIAAAELLF